MKQFFTLLFFCVLTVLSAGEIKYVFLLIGDGFGPSQRAMTEAAIGRGLVMNTLPYSLTNGTDTFDNRTTDSAASGTAIACGIKTHTYAIGVDKDDKPVESLASNLKRTENFRIGIISSCGLTDATPASQYAHQSKRTKYKEIVKDLTKSQFDFFAGSDLYGCNMGENRNPEKVSNVEKGYRKQLADAGYEIIAGEDTPEQLKEQNQLLAENPSLPMPKVYAACLPYTEWKNQTDSFWGKLFGCSGEKKSPYPTLADYLTAAADRFAPNPFFIMLECGKIDHAGHNNDAAWTIREVKAFDAAVAAALDFADKHSGETLVIVTADHETGGLKITDPAKLAENAGILWKQKDPIYKAQGEIQKMIREKADADEILDEIEDILGFDGFTDAEEDQLTGLIETNYAPAKTKIRRFSATEILTKAAAMRDERLGIKYTSRGHTSEKVITNVWGPFKTNPADTIRENSDIRKFIENMLDVK